MSLLAGRDRFACDGNLSQAVVSNSGACRLGSELAGIFFGSANLRRRLQEHAAPKALRHMEALKIRRLPVMNKSKRMVGISSLRRQPFGFR
jgi:CBS-domain-containing membrane protein